MYFVDDMNFSAIIGSLTGVGEIGVLALLDIVPQRDTISDEALQVLTRIEKFYLENNSALGSRTIFAYADVYDRTFVDTFVKTCGREIYNSPIFLFYTGDGSNNIEFYRADRLLTESEIKFYIESKRG